MNKTDFKVTFWGTQGSTAVGNVRKARYGTNTPCISAECGEHVFVFDMGTGFLPFSNYFLQKYPRPKTLDIFISHYHLDHIEGLPFAGLTYTPGVSIHFHCLPIKDRKPDKIFSEIFSPPFFPMDLIVEAPPGRFAFHIFEPGKTLSFGDGAIEMQSFAVPHPGGSLSYKLTYNGKSFCYLSDFEFDGKLMPELAAYLGGCDLTAIDAYFSNDNIVPGWGHSTWEQGVQIWREANLKKLVMYHHNIASLDEDLDKLGDKLRAISDRLIIARDNMEHYI